ncbi:hypothetical protein BVRB_9g205020 [Beta vulgaris subsp. vulgaris]|nr:hypothetical protein BVRB_9g205020 [Beta vulgaris subsp. vulgaris]
MAKYFILDLLRHCKTFPQLHQIHANAITTGTLTLYPCFLLPNVLFTIARLAASNRGAASSSMKNYAVSVFNIIRSPTTFCYNTMMRVENLFHAPASALILFIKMRRALVSPDFHTYPFAIKASGNLRVPSIAAALHSLTLKSGFSSDLFVLNSIVHVYAILDRLSDACLLFEESGHKDIISYNALIDGFMKAGNIERARLLFDKMSIRDAVSWGTLIAGYAHMGECQEAIDLFNSLLRSSSGIRPDNIALVSVLSACAQLGDLEQGRAVHDYIIQNGLQVDSFLLTGLVDFYAKCGCIENAINIFESSAEKNLFSWNALLMGLAVHGHGRACLDYFSRMIKGGVRPDDVSVLGVLVGCSHAGLVCEARKIFRDMESVYGVHRELKHYGCMADLFGRAGCVGEVLELIEHMPMQGDIFIWGALLAGCRTYGMVEVAEEAAKHVQKLNPEDSGLYSVMVDIYANSDMWDDVAKTRSSIKTRRIKKNASCSLIKLNDTTHEFIAGDSSHPQKDEIYIILSGLVNHQSEVSL